MRLSPHPNITWCRILLRRWAWTFTEYYFTGYFIHSGKGIEQLTSKTASVQSWQSLATVTKAQLQTEIKRFLSFVHYYRRFITNMSHIASPLYQLLKKDKL
jgi:hypothetical protein